MRKLNVHETKTHLSRHIKDIMNGETILLCKRNIPFAEIRPLPTVPQNPRPIGLAKGTFELTDDFFQPLPEALLKAFQGDEISSDDNSSDK